MWVFFSWQFTSHCLVICSVYTISIELCDLFKDSNTVYIHSLLHIRVDFLMSGKVMEWKMRLDSKIRNIWIFILNFYASINFLDVELAMEYKMRSEHTSVLLWKVFKWWYLYVSEMIANFADPENTYTTSLLVHGPGPQISWFGTKKRDKEWLIFLKTMTPLVYFNVW